MCRHREREELADGRVLCPECAQVWERPDLSAEIVAAIVQLEASGYHVSAAPRPQLKAV